MTAENIAWKE